MGQPSSPQPPPQEGHHSGSKQLIAQALRLRDDSVAAVQPPLVNLPDALPKNVMHIADNVLTREELSITSLDAVELVQLLRKRVYTCEAVTRAFLRRAALAQKLVGYDTPHPAYFTIAPLANHHLGQLCHRTSS